MSDNPATNTISNVKLAGNVFLRTILSAVLNFIMYFSILLIFEFCTTKEVTQIYEKGTDGSYTLVTQYETSGSPSSSETESALSDDSKGNANSSPDISSTNSAENMDDESTQTTSESNLVKQQVRSDMPPLANAFMNILSQILMIILLVSIPYSVLWSLGDKDSNSVHFGHMEEDKLRGLKIGLLAGIPSYVFYSVLFVIKSMNLFIQYIPNNAIEHFTTYYFSVYRYLLNLSFLPITNLFYPNANPPSSDVSWLLMFLMLISLAVLPLTCYLAYSFGYRHISISEKIIYVDPKKKKKKRRY